MQAAGRGLPHYRLVGAEGPNTGSDLKSKCSSEDNRSDAPADDRRREAEQQAAKAALGENT